MANNVFQVKRTNVSGRTPNTTGSYVTNSQYIAAGEFALNMADGILYSSNGSAIIEIGANNTNQRITNSLTVNNSRNLNFQTVNTSAASYFTQQNDDNFVFYSTNTAYGARPVWGIFANSITSNLQIYVPIQFNSGVVANNSLGVAGQVLTTNGSATYWSSVGGTGTVTSVATGNGMTGGPITTTGTVSILANTGIVANSTGAFVNAAYINTISSNSATFLGAAGNFGNSLGIYTSGVSNAATLSTGATFIANATQVTVAVPVSANGGTGTAGHVLTSNGITGSPYWAAAAGGGYYKGGSAEVGTLAVGGQNLFRVNANTLNFNTTIATGENAQATGPITVAPGITLTVQSGARVSIV